MGWQPPSQFKGDPAKALSAEDFVKRGEEFLPFLKANNKRLEQATERASAKIATLEKTIQRLAEHNTKTEQRAYERAVRDIQERLDNATTLGDVAGVRAATEELVDLTKEAASKPAAPVETEDHADPPDFVDWKADNPWFNKDKPLTAAAVAIANEIEAETGMKAGQAYYAEVDKRLRAAFPSKFENPRRAAASAVEAGGQAPRRAGKTYADLPAEAKVICDDFVKRVPGFTREKYIKDFFA
jgi:hypothetical protein